MTGDCFAIIAGQSPVIIVLGKERGLRNGP